MAEQRDEILLTLTADIVTSHVSNNSVAVGDMPGLIVRVHDALRGLGAPAAAPVEERKPAVSVRASVKPDHLVCLDDGQKVKMLKRHLMTHHGLTPDQYRARWSLPASYPMVAPDYAERRKELAVKIGLGRKRKPAAAPAPAPAKRKSAAAAKAPVQARSAPEAAPASAGKTAAAAKPKATRARVPKAQSAPVPAATAASDAAVQPAPRMRRTARPRAVAEG